MKNNLIKKSVVWLLIFAISFASFAVFAEDNIPSVDDPITLSEEIEAVINNLIILSRYDTVSKEKLYKTAF